MKILHGFLAFIFWLSILATGLWLVAACFGVDCAAGVDRAVLSLITDGTMRVQRMTIGGILILAVVVYWLSALPTRREELSLSYECEDGRVSISIKAINALLSKLADEFAAITALRASVNPRTRAVRLDMTAKSGAKIQELSHALQQRVRESLQDSLGITDIGDIRVFVSEITPPENSQTKEEHGEWQNIPI